MFDTAIRAISTATQLRKRRGEYSGHRHSWPKPSADDIARLQAPARAVDHEDLAAVQHLRIGDAQRLGADRGPRTLVRPEDLPRWHVIPPGRRTRHPALLHRDRLRDVHR